MDTGESIFDSAVADLPDGNTESAAPIETSSSEVKTESKTENSGAKLANSFDKHFEDVTDAEIDDAAFKKSDKKIEAEAKQEPESDSKEVETQEPQLKILPPPQLTKSQQADFEKLPITLKAGVSKLLNDYRKELSKVGEFRPVWEEAKTYEAEIGVKSNEIVKNAIQWDKAFRQDTKQAAKAFLQAYKLDPLDLLDDSDQMPGHSQQQLSQEDIDRLVEQKLNARLEAQEAKSQEQAFYQRGQQAQADIQTFMKSSELFQDPQVAIQLEEALAPVVEHYNDLYPTATPMQILKKAYNEITSDDSLPFKALLSAKEKAAKLEKARQASKSINGGIKSPTKSIKNLKGFDNILEHHFKDFDL